MNDSAKLMLLQLHYIIANVSVNIFRGLRASYLCSNNNCNTMEPDYESEFASEHDASCSGDDSAQDASPVNLTEDEVNQVKKLTRNESKGIWIGKFLVVVTILATAALVSVGSYIVLREDEKSSFKTSVCTTNVWLSQHVDHFSFSMSYLWSHSSSRSPTLSRTPRSSIFVTLHFQ